MGKTIRDSSFKTRLGRDIVDNCRDTCESKISAGSTEKLPGTGNLDANISSRSHEMVGNAKKCVERYCELANKTTQQIYKVATPCIDDHQFKEEEMGSDGDLSKIAQKMF